ncbi:MAG TPA: tetratricopeptide repeat protein [Thermoanaerobaculia bacterium]|nr:tetratricopeptide repeat protein [Thermoanaerobaculia bacterium]
MNQRLTRKEIKRDEFSAAVGRGVEYAGSHVRIIGYAVGAVLLLAVLGVAFYFWRNSRIQGANEALTQAVKVYQAPVTATGAKPNDPDEPSFATEAARRTKAKELLAKVRDGYGSTSAADVAGLYLAQIAADEGRLDDARQAWQEFVDDHGDHILAGEARLNLINLDRKQGKGQQVAQELRRMLEQNDPALPQDVILYELAQTQEQLGRGQEAAQTYQRILDEFPQSPYGTEAQQKVSALDPSRAGVPAGLPQGIPGFPG